MSNLDRIGDGFGGTLKHTGPLNGNVCGSCLFLSGDSCKQVIQEDFERVLCGVWKVPCTACMRGVAEPCMTDWAPVDTSDLLDRVWLGNLYVHNPRFEAYRKVSESPSFPDHPSGWRDAAADMLRVGNADDNADEQVFKLLFKHSYDAYRLSLAHVQALENMRRVVQSVLYRPSTERIDFGFPEDVYPPLMSESDIVRSYEHTIHQLKSAERMVTRALKDCGYWDK